MNWTSNDPDLRHGFPDYDSVPIRWGWIFGTFVEIMVLTAAGMAAFYLWR